MAEEDGRRGGCWKLPPLFSLRVKEEPGGIRTCCCCWVRIGSRFGGIGCCDGGGAGGGGRRDADGGAWPAAADRSRRSKEDEEGPNDK